MSIRVHIADDHGVFRSGLKALLEEQADFEVVSETSTGPETVRAMEEADVDVLLLDINMPGMSGNRVAQAVLAQRPDMAIVVLTMHEEVRYAEELLGIGVQAFVLKRSTGIASTTSLPTTTPLNGSAGAASSQLTKCCKCAALLAMVAA